MRKNKILMKKGYVLHVMIYDLIFGLKKIQGGGTLKKEILGYEEAMNEALKELKIDHNVKTNEELIPEHLQNQIILPRYSRINLLKSTVEEVLKHLEDEGWKLIQYDNFIQTIETAKKSQTDLFFSIDKDFNDVLLFLPNTDFHNHPLVLDGRLILQDKASYMSGKALNPPASENTYCIDACAAPGQKTSQLAQSMENKGTLIAVDKDSKRLATLKKITNRNGVTNLTAINKSFLDINPDEDPYCKVEYILLDPSCSGSGIINRQDFIDNNDSSFLNQNSKERIKTLSDFQISMLNHALSFPNLKRIVYSTCSIHEEENEIVVESVLKENPHFELESIFPEYKSRGLSKYEHGDKCVRTSPEIDKTIGFFVSLFVRNPNIVKAKRERIEKPTTLNENIGVISNDIVNFETNDDLKEGDNLNSTPQIPQKKKRKKGKSKPIVFKNR